MNGTEFARIGGSYSTAYIGTYQLTGQSTTNNTSTFILRAYFYYGGGSSVNSSYSTFKIDGTTVKSGGYTYGSGYHLLGSKTITVTHNSNGSWPGRNVTISANAYHMSGSRSGGLSAPTIKRYPVIKSATDFKDTANPSMTFTSYGSFPLRVKLEAGGNSKLITRDISKTATSYTFSLSETERNKLRALASKSNTLSVRFTVCAMNGNNELSASYLNRTMTIVDANPTFSNFEFEDTNSVTTALTGDNQKIIQGYSNIRVTIPENYKATANKQATMSKYSFVCSDIQRNISYVSSGSTSNSIENVKSGVFNVYAIDSRNNSTLVTKNATDTISYTPLIKDSVSVTRSNGISEITTLDFSGKVNLVNFGAVTNSIKTAKFRYKSTDADSWSNYKDITLTVDANGKFSYSDYVIGDTISGFDINNSYNFEVLIADELSQVVFVDTLSSGIPNIALDKQGVGIMGKYDTSEGGLLQVGGINISSIIGEVIADYTIEDSTTASVSFDVDVGPGEWLDVVISGGSLAGSDIKLRINDVSGTQYFQTGFYFAGTGSSDGASLSQYTGYRKQRDSFYYGRSLSPIWGTVSDKIGFTIRGSGRYYPMVKWSSNATYDNNQVISSCIGLLNSETDQITKITYFTSSSYFLKGTNIKIIKTINGCMQ